MVFVGFLGDLQARWFCPGWYFKYGRRALRATRGYSERGNGLDKHDIHLLLSYAYEESIVKADRTRRRTSRQMRATLKHHYALIFEKLGAEHQAQINANVASTR